MTRRGLVALGDSITNGHGEPALGVTMQSWAQWLAEALGAAVHQARARRRPRGATCWPSRSRAWKAPTTSAACTRASTTPARPTGTPAPTARPLRATASALAACSERLLLCTLPADLGRPRAAPKPRAASAIVRAVAGDHDAALADLDDLAGPPWLLPDAVHPTARGQLEIADRAARALGAATLPSSLIEVHELAPRPRPLRRPLGRDAGRATCAGARWSASSRP